MTNSLFLSIENNWFEKTKKQAEKDAKANKGEESNSLEWEQLSIVPAEITFEEGELNVAIAFQDGDPLIEVGYISITLEDLPDHVLLKIIEYTIKKLNKFKTVIEAVK